jgi:hypothetical protein
VCVDRSWTAQVNAEDDTVIDLQVKIKPPDFDVISQLFPGHHVDFGRAALRT